VCGKGEEKREGEGERATEKEEASRWEFVWVGSKGKPLFGCLFLNVFRAKSVNLC